ncbi:hypothetical protein AVEN_159996-1 [Araneus ventricosus]|uniref:Retrotransposon gag domain-containing protein n=1 Tax=Araneus ventricosus TaxID=182803 RepID=A0A4Y2L7J4_ARAVE|nr:hypothetical protein AVEN_159996-1 [Araneus ventricosus]
MMDLACSRFAYAAVAGWNRVSSLNPFSFEAETLSSSHRLPRNLRRKGCQGVLFENDFAGRNIKNPSLLSTIPNLNGNNAGEFFRVLEETAILGQWSKPQLIAIGKLKLEGRARCFYDACLMESERVRDFASRIEGLAHKSFNGSDVGASGMSEELREKMLLFQFTAEEMGPHINPPINMPLGTSENPSSYPATSYPPILGAPSPWPTGMRRPTRLTAFNWMSHAQWASAEESRLLSLHVTR